MIIDCHGHYTTVPPEMQMYRQRNETGCEGSHWQS
jgi:hypothetical protein